jgi:hypothetical protein
VTRYYQALVGFIVVLCFFPGCGGPHTGRFEDMVGWRLLQVVSFLGAALGFLAAPSYGTYHHSKLKLAACIVEMAVGVAVLLATIDYESRPR